MARKNIYFTAGPAELYPEFENYLQEAIDEQIGSISHRSQRFRDIYKFTDEQLRILMDIPENTGVFFTGSASEVWERILLNIVQSDSFHLVNGSFSEKFYKYAKSLNKQAHLQEKSLGEGFDLDEIVVPDAAELICTTHNETSTGVMTPADTIHALKKANLDKFIAVDMVSSAPYPALDYGLVDTAFFSVQKAFGLPAGLGVWLANEKCLERANSLKKTQTIGGHHDLPTLWKNYEKFETPATPNTLLIYLLGKVAEDMNKKGIEQIRKETDEKADKIYDFLQKSDKFSVNVEKAAHRSRTVAVADCAVPSAEIIANLKKKNIILGAGYGPKKDSQIRISNFPANSMEQVELLLDELGKM
jgi:phosphoserine aminotransferase